MSELIASLDVPAAFNSAGRKSNYTQIYPKDNQGDEAKNDARVWNVYLDEREYHDAAMIQSFRNVVDNLLTFAALFSGVVATFVVTTASELSPDNTQIIAALLLENNQLLRAAGNSTSLNAVPPASLSPGSPTHTTIDLWVNGSFFASLALSLLTALATVLVKQWLQSYTLLITGTPRDRALVSHFRFEGLVRWHLPTIIESLPLILHISLVLFLAGFALYAFQLLRPLCWTIVGISSIAFIFYTIIFLPAFFADCPYRVPCIWHIPQYVIYPLHFARQALVFLWRCSKCRKILSLKNFDWPAFPKKSWAKAEHDAVLPLVSGKSLKKTFPATYHNICDALCWIFNHASNQSVKDVVIEAVTGLLHDWTALLQDIVFEKQQVSDVDFETVKGDILKHDLFPAVVDYSLKKLSTRESESTEDHNVVGPARCGQLLEALLATDSPQPLMNLSIERTKHDWRKKIQPKLDIAYQAAALGSDHVLAKKLLGWGADILPTSTTSEIPFLHDVARRGDVEIITDILDRKPEYLYQIDGHGLSALHFAASHGRLDAVAALVERGASLEILSHSPDKPSKAIDLALRNDHPEVVAYLLDHHASRPAYALHEAAKFKDSQMAEVLLDRGWSKLEKNGQGQTPVDVATLWDNGDTARFLDEYEPAPLNPTFHRHKVS